MHKFDAVALENEYFILRLKIKKNQFFYNRLSHSTPKKLRYIHSFHHGNLFTEINNWRMKKIFWLNMFSNHNHIGTIYFLNIFNTLINLIGIFSTKKFMELVPLSRA